MGGNSKTVSFFVLVGVAAGVKVVVVVVVVDLAVAENFEP